MIVLLSYCSQLFSQTEASQDQEDELLYGTRVSYFEVSHDSMLISR